MRRIRTFLAVLILLSMPGVAGMPGVSGIGVAWGRPLQGKVNALLNTGRIERDQVGLMIVDLGTDETLASVEPTRSMIPASNLKLVTTAAALGVLGPDFVFQTRLRVVEPDDWPADVDLGASDQALRSAPIVVVQGDGDPAFLDPVLMEKFGYGQDIHDIEQFLDLWVDYVKQAGVERVSKLFVDDRVLDREFVHPSWPVNNLNAWYSAPVAGVNFNDNCIDVYASPADKVGESPTIRLSPIMPFLRTSNNARTATTDTFWVNRQQGTNHLTFFGNVKHHRTSPTPITMHDPPMLFAQLLADRLEDAGIVVEGFGRPDDGQQLPDGRTIHIVQTDLPTVITRCNKNSQNMFAEALIKRMGRHITGAPGSWETGGAAVRQFLQERLGTRAAAIRIADGSGLSRDNRLSAEALVTLLGAMYEDTTLGPLFVHSLAIGGEDGTLARRFRQPLEGAVRGKSGYINRVSALSGYYMLAGEAGEGDRVIAFSFLFNDFKPPVHVHHVKKLQEDLVRMIEDYALSRRKTAVGG